MDSQFWASVSTMMAIFSVIIALGGAFFFSVCFIRMRKSFDIVKKQNLIFSETIVMVEERFAEFERKYYDLSYSLAMANGKIRDYTSQKDQIIKSIEKDIGAVREKISKLDNYMNVQEVTKRQNMPRYVYGSTQNGYSHEIMGEEDVSFVKRYAQSLV